MGTIVHAYNPNQSVYVIDNCGGNPFITSGVVVRVRAEALVTGNTVRYDIRLDGGTGTREFVEASVFANKADALVAYDALIS